MNTPFDSKGQSALEYLMTYGWALVVIVIVIAALFAFGIFNPPDAGTCTGLNKLAYIQHSISNGNVFLRVSNGTGGQIVLSSVDFNSANNAFTASAVTPGTGFSSATVLSASPVDVNTIGLTSNPAAFASGPYSQKVTLFYVQAGIPHQEVATCTGNA